MVAVHSFPRVMMKPDLLFDHIASDEALGDTIIRALTSDYRDLGHPVLRTLKMTLANTSSK